MIQLLLNKTTPAFTFVPDYTVMSRAFTVTKNPNNTMWLCDTRSHGLMQNTHNWWAFLFGAVVDKNQNVRPRNSVSNSATQ